MMVLMLFSLYFYATHCNIPFNVTDNGKIRTCHIGR